MYRVLCGIYLSPVVLSITSCLGAGNVYSGTLELYSTKLNTITRYVQESISALKDYCKIKVNSQKKIMPSPISTFNVDMKGQQNAANIIDKSTRFSTSVSTPPSALPRCHREYCPRVAARDSSDAVWLAWCSP